MRVSGFAIALMIFMFMMMSGMGRMAGSWIMGQMLFPFLIVVVIVLLVRSQPRHVWHEQRRASDRIAPPTGGTPEEILRQRYARGELSRDQYQEAIIELLKGRYVTGELTLEEYEARVGTLISDVPLRRLEGDTRKGYL